MPTGIPIVDVIIHIIAFPIQLMKFVMFTILDTIAFDILKLGQ